MKRWSVRQLFAFFLAAFVAAGMSASAVQASAMAVKMGMASDMGAAGKSCDGCKGSDGAKTMNCAPACVAPTFAMLPQIEPTRLAQTATKLPLPGSTLLLGSTSPPDPYPPRPTDIG
jgi:hypothetical protein